MALIPALTRKRSALRCVPLPTPADANLSEPGRGEHPAERYGQARIAPNVDFKTFGGMPIGRGRDRLPVLLCLIVLALAFDFLNGLHDAANSIATVVTTRILKPRTAVVWAAFFNFIAFAMFGLHVARTIGTGIVEAGLVDVRVVFGALIGGIVWNVVTWRLGIPSSSSHALIGGLAGAGIAKGGLGVVVWGGLGIIVAGIVRSPLLGFVLAQLLVLVVRWATLTSTPYSIDRRFRVLQIGSASLYSLGHGGNDAQKTMAQIGCVSAAFSMRCRCPAPRNQHAN
jgi:phosphate/sulfate permease